MVLLWAYGHTFHRYDTFTFVKKEPIRFVLEESNYYHPNLQFTFELENVDKLSFLDFLVIRQSNNKVETTVYRKNANKDIYLNWFSDAPNTWKRETLSVGKSCLYIMFNGSPSNRRVSLPRKSIRGKK